MLPAVALQSDALIIDLVNFQMSCSLVVTV